jgi:DNA-binding sugar fermentation-stimulating protein
MLAATIVVALKSLMAQGQDIAMFPNCASARPVKNFDLKQTE